MVTVLPLRRIAPSTDRFLILAVAAAFALPGCTARSAEEQRAVLRAPRAVPGDPDAEQAAGSTEHAEPGALFTDIAPSSGIRFRHVSGRSGRLYLPETMGSGCAFLDYDGDGRLDLFLVNSGRLPGFSGKGPYYPALYRNRGDAGFVDVTRQAGLAVEGYGMGVAVGDYDNDGDPDLYLTAMGPNRLFRNNRDGSFTDVTKQAGVGEPIGRPPPHWSSSAAWLDYDRDGDLDLFVCNYCVWSEKLKTVCPDSQGRRHICTPNFYEGAPSTLYQYRGDGSFSDVTKAAGVYNPTGKSLALTVWDENDDGWPDIAIANDLEPDLLYRNQKDGTFREVGVEAGIAYSAAGRARAGMGMDTADETGSGRESLLVGNFSNESLGLYRNDGAGRYTDAAGEAGLRTPSLPFLTFGVLFADYDLDGLPDILTANGHIDENVHLMGGSITFRQRLLLFHNEGEGRYREVGETAGEAFTRPILARGIARGDVDEDGDPDFLVSVNAGAPMLLRNELRESAARPRWLHVRAVGTRSNRSAFGTRIVIEAGGRRQMGWIRSASGGYCSQSEAAVHFGLGTATQVDRMEIRWPNGRTETRLDLAVDQRLVLREP